MNPLLLVHISAGALGILSGAIAMTARKGSRLHARAGLAFVATIITMGLTGAMVAVTRWLIQPQAYQVGNLLMGLFTSYLTATGWVTARRRAKEVGGQDWTLLSIGALLAASFAAAGLATAAGAVWLQHGLGAPFFFVIGSIAALAVWGDVRLLMSGGIVGTPRLRRHLWRISTAMLITVLSFFIGQAQVLPRWLVQTKVNILPVLATAAFLVFWLVKMRAPKATQTLSPAVSS